MCKRIILGICLLFASVSFAASQYDKDIIVKDQSRNDKATEVFKAMMQEYEDEYMRGFFSYVSEDRFLQDYMTFFEAIEKDLRDYDILSVDTWVEKITDDGVKRYLYVKWEKRYESASGSSVQTQKGYSRFLFDEINGEYKLIELAGNNFWGASLAEWREEVPQIAGQEVYVVNTPTQSGGGASSGGLPDLTIGCPNPPYLTIYNIGTASTTSGSIPYSGSLGGGTYNNDIPAGGNSGDIFGGTGCPASVSDYVIVNPDSTIVESNYSNNTYPAP